MGDLFLMKCDLGDKSIVLISCSSRSKQKETGSLVLQTVTQKSVCLQLLGTLADPETPRGGGKFANKLFFFSVNITIYRNKV